MDDADDGYEPSWTPVGTDPWLAGQVSILSRLSRLQGDEIKRLQEQVAALEAFAGTGDYYDADY
jgi:hypothetical protein